MSEQRAALIVTRPDDAPCVAARSAMRTRFELVIAACDAPRRDWEAIAEEALDLAEDWHARLTRFEPGSPVWLINERAGTADPTPIDGAMLDTLHACTRLTRLTGGAFDPTRSGDLDALEIDEHAMTARLTRPGVSLDFGAAGKGAALDDIGATLRSLGVTGALLHGGTSSVLAIGGPPRNARADGAACGPHGWRVRAGAAVITLRDAALGLSAPAAGDALGTPHLIDPATGRHVSHAAPPAAVVCERALDADAWATALAVDPGLLLPAGVRTIDFEPSTTGPAPTTPPTPAAREA